MDNADYNPHNAHMKDKETLGVWGIISHKKRWLTWGGSHDRATDFMRDLQEDIKFEGYDLSLIYFESEEDLNNHEYN